MATPLASNPDVTWYYVAKYRRCAFSPRGRPPHLRPAPVITSRSGRDRGIILERARSIFHGQKMKSLSASPHTELHKGVQSLWSIVQEAQTLGPDKFPSFIPVSAPNPSRGLCSRLGVVGDLSLAARVALDRIAGTAHRDRVGNRHRGLRH